MKTTVYALSAILLGFAGRPAAAQYLPLQALTKDAAEGRLAESAVQAYLPVGDWELHKAAPVPYWLFVAVAPTSEEIPAGAETRLELRRPNQQFQPDVLYKTTYKDCMARLRTELRRTKLTGEAVTCLQCSATRYTAPGYTITVYEQPDLYEQRKVSHPFILVVHSTVPPAPLLAGDAK